MSFFCLQQLITRALRAANGALDRSGASDAGKYAKERWYESKTPTFTSSVSPAPVRHGNLIRINTTRQVLERTNCRSAVVNAHAGVVLQSLRAWVVLVMNVVKVKQDGTQIPVVD